MYQCAVCGRADVRLYRSYGSFLRNEEIFCNGHVPGKVAERGWWVPLVEAEDGFVWGYTSAPTEDIRRWHGLHDAQTPGPIWANGRWIDTSYTPPLDC